MSLIDPVTLASQLIQCPSVTPANEGALELVEKHLTQLGFTCSPLTFDAPETPSVKNLYARWGNGAPHLCFAGHTDVVPAGDPTAWTVEPFSGLQQDGKLWGRGASDMKGAIAAFISATAKAIDKGVVKGSLGFLITGDEEGAAINGTKKLLNWMAENNHPISHCLVGEPTNPGQMGEMIKVGRRGSINFWVTIKGVQGHVAYPDRAQNPIPALAQVITKLTQTPLDDGYEHFQPSSLQVTDISLGNEAHNVIPGSAIARFNIRFNPNYTGQSIKAWIVDQLNAVTNPVGINYKLKTIVSGEAFLTRDSEFIDLIVASVQSISGSNPELSTSGGTSDARFIKDFAPVAEFGLVGATMHQVDEHVASNDILMLENIYFDFIQRYFQKFGAAS